MQLLEGKSIAITGGGGGLGRCYGLAMANAGASVAVADIDMHAAQATADAITQAGGRAIAVHADVTRAAAFESLLDRTEAALGPIDVLVNIAGMFPRRALVEMEEAEWDAVITLNLKSVYLGARAAIRRMLPRRRGVVLSTASGTGILTSAGLVLLSAPTSVILTMVVGLLTGVQVLTARAIGEGRGDRRVGRIASCASCAFFDLVWYWRGASGT